MDSKAAIWIGRILSAIPAIFILTGGVAAATKASFAVQGMYHYGYSIHAALLIGLAAVVGAVLYLAPPTAVLGAVLLTAYLGGAVATHVRMGEPFLMPILMGVLVWVGLYLREPRLRHLTPVKKKAI